MGFVSGDHTHHSVTETSSRMDGKALESVQAKNNRDIFVDGDHTNDDTDESPTVVTASISKVNPAHIGKQRQGHLKATAQGEQGTQKDQITTDLAIHNNCQSTIFSGAIVRTVDGWQQHRWEKLKPNEEFVLEGVTDTAVFVYAVSPSILHVWDGANDGCKMVDGLCYREVNIGTLHPRQVVHHLSCDSTDQDHDGLNSSHRDLKTGAAGTESVLESFRNGGSNNGGDGDSDGGDGDSGGDNGSGGGDEDEDASGRQSGNEGNDGTPKPGTPAYEWLTGHNSRRQRLYSENGLPDLDLEWSSTLEADAQSYAEYLISQGCFLAHDYTASAGENLALNWGSGSYAYSRSPDEVLTAWFEEEEFLPLSQNGHFRQVGWRATHYVGCGAAEAEYSGGMCYIQVCRYIRPGNCNTRVHPGGWFAAMLDNYSPCRPFCPEEGCS